MSRIVLSVFDALYGVVSSDAGAFFSGLIIHQSAYKSRSVYIAGAVAARTVKPVIGIPVAGSPIGGLDALYATVQMPAGFPVATVALNGAKNAAWLAAQIVALNDERVAALIRAEREGYKTAVESAAVELEERYA